MLVLYSSFIQLLFQIKSTPTPAHNVLGCLYFGPSVLRATSDLAEQLRETTIFGIFPLGVLGVTLLAFTPEGVVVGF